MELTRFQKIILAVLAGMLAVFSILMAILRAHPGALFEESPLRITEHAGGTVYSGRVHGTPVTITAVRDSETRTTVTFSISGAAEDVCLVEYPLEPIRTEYDPTVSGIRISKNGQLLFQGGYDADSNWGWFDQDGQWTPLISMLFSSSVNPWPAYEPQPADIAAFAFGPAEAARGSPFTFSMAVLLSVLLAAEVLFHKELFRWRHWGARDPEPSEAYLAFERAGWIGMAGAAAFLYIAAMIQID